LLAKIHEDGVKTTEESAVIAGADYVPPPTPFEAFYITSGRIVTGANPASAHITARAAIEAFERT
jgi:D-lactate dehydratase